MLLAVRTVRRSTVTLATLVAWMLLVVPAYFIVAPFFDEGVKKEHYTLLAALMAAAMALIQLRSQATTRRGQFVSEYLTKFYLDDALWRTYNELIYRYHDSFFEQVDIEAIKDGSIAKSIEDIKRGKAPDVPVQRTSSAAWYHPWTFQYSDRERRLDALFGYLRVIDYYCAKGLIGTGEVYRQLGTFLLTIADRKVVKQYIEVNEFAWSLGAYNRSKGVDSPMRGAKNLLDCVETYDWFLRYKRVPSVWHDGGESGRER